MITTEAWVLHKGSQHSKSALDMGEFRKEPYSFPDLEEDEVLVEPLFGSWEGNMSHALAREPIDVCELRKEDAVVVGNAGLVRVLRPGRRAQHVREGDVGVLWGSNRQDRFGYMTHAHAYDAPGSVGLLAKQTKISASQFLPLPVKSRFSYKQWAAYGVRYLTAWANWQVAYGAYRLQVTPEEDPAPHVWGWGGGTTFAELDLARRHGCEATMISGNSSHIELIKGAGITSVDRGSFPHIAFDEKKYSTDPTYKAAYQESESKLLRLVQEMTKGMGVAIFVDYIGSPVSRVTLKALAREGVITTAGWMQGMNISVNRAAACLRRNIHVHTHYARMVHWHDASAFSEKTGWMPSVTDVHRWDDIELLARSASIGKTSYFPLYEVNPV